MQNVLHTEKTKTLQDWNILVSGGQNENRRSTRNSLKYIKLDIIFQKYISQNIITFEFRV